MDDGRHSRSVDSDSSTYDIRPLSLAEYENHVVQWAREFSWDLGLNDFTYFTRASPDCFLAGVLDGSPIANISVFPEGTRYAHLALYVVAPRYRQRGLGYGRRLFDAAVARMPATMCLGLDAVKDNVPMYLKSGFKVAEGVTVMRYTITVDRHDGSQSPKPENGGKTSTLSKVSSPDLLDKVVDYDKAVTSLDRGALFHSWLTAADKTVGTDCSSMDRYAVCAVRGSDVVGYGVCSPLRTCDEHGPFVVGPVCCDTEDIAVSIFEHLLGRLRKGTACVLFSPSKHSETVLKRCRWRKDGSPLTRMHLCRPSSHEPRYELWRIYAGYTPDIA